MGVEVVVEKNGRVRRGKLDKQGKPEFTDEDPLEQQDYFLSGCGPGGLAVILIWGIFIAWLYYIYVLG